VPPVKLKIEFVKHRGPPG